MKNLCKVVYTNGRERGNDQVTLEGLIKQRLTQRSLLGRGSEGEGWKGGSRIKKKGPRADRLRGYRVKQTSTLTPNSLQFRNLGSKGLQRGSIMTEKKDYTVNFLRDR